jgi:hypothetical protein
LPKKPNLPLLQTAIPDVLNFSLETSHGEQMKTRSEHFSQNTEPFFHKNFLPTNSPKNQKDLVLLNSLPELKHKLLSMMLTILTSMEDLPKSHSPTTNPKEPDPKEEAEVDTNKEETEEVSKEETEEDTKDHLTKAKDFQHLLEIWASKVPKPQLKVSSPAAEMLLMSELLKTPKTERAEDFAMWILIQQVA